MPARQNRSQLLREALAERVLVFDGSYGVALTSAGLTAADYGGPQFEGCPEALLLSRPEMVRDIHRAYLEAGADLLLTNTFGGTSIVLAEYGLEARTAEINHIAARIAREAADAIATPAKPRFVIGDIGPTTKAITVTGGIDFEGIRDVFYEQARALAEGGVDALLLETQQDTRNIKAGLIGIRRAFAELGFELPVMVSATIEQTGTMLAGQTVDALSAAMTYADLLSIGLNCSTGPEFMTDHIRTLAGMSEYFTSVVPNAGLPDEDGNYGETALQMASVLERFIDNGWINIIGGCCGTTAEHIRTMAQMADGKRPRVPQPNTRTMFSGIDYVEANDDDRPLIIGERTNEVGSRKFKRLITEEKYE